MCGPWNNKQTLTFIELLMSDAWFNPKPSFSFLAYVRHFCTMSLHIYFSILKLSFLSIQLTGGQCGSWYKECMWPPKGWPLCPQAVYVVPQEMTPYKFSSDPLWCWLNWLIYLGSAAGYYQNLSTSQRTVFNLRSCSVNFKEICCSLCSIQPNQLVQVSATLLEM